MKKMQEVLGLQDEARLQTLVDIKDKYLSGEYSLEKARAELKEKIGTCTPWEFACGEQTLKDAYDDEEQAHRIDDLLKLFDGILVRTENDYPLFHPLWVYMEEVKAARALADEAEALSKEQPFIKNKWLPIFEKLATWHTHLSRKQNQLYPMLEKVGFDRPTKVMWTFDDTVRDSISASYRMLRADDEKGFLASLPDMLYNFRDLLGKEEEILFPTSRKLLTEDDFITMSRGDHEIGFSLIAPPPFYGVMKKEKEEAPASTDFMKDLAALLGKYNIAPSGTPDPDQELDVATGKLTLDRINLIFKHMPVDLSYVDENEIVKFYSDTKHRVFPRSANVIGRLVKNCHPAKSVHIVEEIIEKFRSGEQDKAEFWINKPDLFIYITYVAVRNEKGEFKGVLEMMQDCTHIRSLEGSRTLLTWDNETHGEAKEEIQAEPSAKNEEKAIEGKAEGPLSITVTNKSGKTFTLTPETKLFPLFDEVKGLKNHMPSINTNFMVLHTPIAKMMAGKATIAKASERSGMELQKLMQAIADFIKESE